MHPNKPYTRLEALAVKVAEQARLSTVRFAEFSRYNGAVEVSSPTIDRLLGETGWRDVSYYELPDHLREQWDEWARINGYQPGQVFRKYNELRFVEHYVWDD